MKKKARPVARRAAPKQSSPRPRVQLEVLDRMRPRTDRRFLRAVVGEVLNFAGQPELPVSLLLTDDAGIAALHAAHLGDASPTDVMSFAIDGGAEIVVSVETARRVARRHRHDAHAELALYIVHGILHLVGHDDRRAVDRRRMRRAEQQVMTRLRLVVRAVDD